MTTRHGKRQKGFAVLITALSMMMIIPVVGLAIDASFLYAVRAKLSAATDASSLAAARSLNVGLSIGEQAAEAQSRAQAFFHANFPDGFLATTNKQINVSIAETSYRTRTVEVVATVDAPVFFMRVLGFEETTVASGGKASRRDVNLILVLDRSGSMNNSSSCEPMKAAARQFVSMFANDRDRLGMITFGLTYLRAYAPAMNFKTSSPTLDSMIAGIDCSGGTGTAQALWKGYEELQAVNEPGTLNLIVFFTDGLPNGITASYPVKTRTDYRYGYYEDDGDSANYYGGTGNYYSMEPSTCRDAEGDRYDRNAGQYSRNYYAPNWNPNWNPANKVGAFAGQGNAIDSTGYTFGVSNYQATSLTVHNEGPISNSSGCTFSYNGMWYNSRRDVAYIPSQDLYGNSMHGYVPYSSSDLYSGGAYVGEIRADRPITVGKASKNAADNAARTMRQDPNLGVVIYSIGLGDPSGTTTPPDPDFMMRVANDPSSPVFDPSEQVGLYAFAPDNTQLSQAFARVASEILRISN